MSGKWDSAEILQVYGRFRYRRMKALIVHNLILGGH